MTTITIVGNLTADPEVRFTRNGAAVANLNIAVNDRIKRGDQWVDGEPTFFRATCWDAAENIADSLRKGMRVIATGDVRTEAYETRDGEKRTSLTLTVRAIGPELRFATAQVTRSQGGGQRQQGTQARQQDPWSAAPDPDEPPF